jgi:hypothetical protein
MGLTTGSRLGPYESCPPAITILPRLFVVTEPERLARFDARRRVAFWN